MNKKIIILITVVSLFLIGLFIVGTKKIYTQYEVLQEDHQVLMYLFATSTSPGGVVYNGLTQETYSAIISIQKLMAEQASSTKK